MTTLFAVESIDVDLPVLGRRRLVFVDAPHASSRITVLVGRNGTGKSTILRELTMSFRQYFAAKALRSRQGLGRISEIRIVSDQQREILAVGSDATAFRKEREEIHRRGGGPTRLIALSFTPFDKFPPIDDTADLGHPEAVKPFYVYLGFKSDFRMSPRARLLRSIDALAFADSTVRSDGRVERAFAAIGYAPVIRLSYAFDSKGSRMSKSPVDGARIEMLAEELRAVAGRPPSMQPTSLSYEIDFRHGRRDASIPIDFEEIRELTRARVLRLNSVTLDRIDGGSVELLELSSGELNLLSGFLGLAAFLEDGSLVLIDEPENSLHPEWQLRYVEMLEAVLEQHQGCHYIIATHSPLIVSGVAERDAKVLRLDQSQIEISSKALANASPDATLLNAFKVVTANNNFLKQLVLEALALIDTGKHRSQRAKEIAAFLASIYEQVPADDPLRELIANVVQSILLP